jgi:copper chaperone NosL
MNIKIPLVGIFIILILPFIGCEPKPQPINFGADTCVYCIMLISEHQYGAVLVTNKGKVYKFDAVECMGAYYLEERIPRENIHSMWTVDFEHPGELINVEDAIYLYSPNLSSPMGLNVSAYGNTEFARSMQQQYEGEIIDLDKVMDLVETVWLPQWGQMYR